MTAIDRAREFDEVRAIGLKLLCLNHRRRYQKMILDSDPLMQVFSTEEMRASSKAKIKEFDPSTKELWTLEELGQDILRNKDGGDKSVADVTRILLKISVLVELSNGYGIGDNFKRTKNILKGDAPYIDPVFTSDGYNLIKIEIERLKDLSVERQKLLDVKQNEANGIFEVTESEVKK